MAQSVLDPVRGRSSAHAEAKPVSVVSLTPPHRRRPEWMLWGAVMVVVAAVAGAWAFSSASARVSIVVAARDLEPGDVLEATDLRVVEIGSAGDMRAVQASQQSLVIGRVARGPIPAGTVLNTDLFADPGTSVPDGFVVIGAPLDAGTAPIGSLAAGDPVDVIGVVKSTATDGGVAEVITRASVWAVDRPDTSSASPKVWVSLLVPVDSQTAVAHASADGRLRLSLVGVSK